MSRTVFKYPYIHSLIVLTCQRSPQRNPWENTQQLFGMYSGKPRMTQKNWNHLGRIRKWIPPKDKTTCVFVSGFGRMPSNAIRWVMCVLYLSIIVIIRGLSRWFTLVCNAGQRWRIWGFSPAVGCSPASAETQCSSSLISCCRKHNTQVLMGLDLTLLLKYVTTKHNI